MAADAAGNPASSPPAATIKDVLKAVREAERLALECSRAVHERQLDNDPSSFLRLEREHSILDIDQCARGWTGLQRARRMIEQIANLSGKDR